MKTTPVVKWHVLLGLIAIILATKPLFFDIYRWAAFNPVPRDDYAPYLLSLLGLSDFIPQAPWGYRWLSLVPAIPVYHLLPYVHSYPNLPSVPYEWLKATQALCIVSYFAIILTAIVTYLCANKRAKASRIASLCSSLVALLLSGFIFKEGVDPFAIFIISLLVYYQHNKRAFTVLVVCSAWINEKISLMFLAVIATRLIFKKRLIGEEQPFRYTSQLLASGIGATLYFATVMIVNLPGGEHQLLPSRWLHCIEFARYFLLSPKGLFSALIPLTILGIMALLATKASSGQDCKALNIYYPTDAVSSVIVLVMAIMAGIGANIGRVLMYSYPIYLPLIAIYLDKYIKGASPKGHDDIGLSNEADNDVF